MIEKVGGQDRAGIEDLNADELTAAPVERDGGVEPPGAGARVVAWPGRSGWSVRCR
ncbi:MAG TPA: hypothetical protein VIJ82_12605 [Streptosporangiaceae bacterium]